MIFKIDGGSKEPIYKQLVMQVKKALHDGSLKAGEQIPSMNDLAAKLANASYAEKIHIEKRDAAKRLHRFHHKGGLAHPPRPLHHDVLAAFDKF